MNPSALPKHGLTYFAIGRGASVSVVESAPHSFIGFRLNCKFAENLILPQHKILLNFIGLNVYLFRLVLLHRAVKNKQD